jgi:hypothetical protein
MLVEEVRPRIINTVHVGTRVKPRFSMMLELAAPTNPVDDTPVNDSIEDTPKNVTLECVRKYNENMRALNRFEMPLTMCNWISLRLKAERNIQMVIAVRMHL